eukprot:659241-Lingulodinium_polyedra.AAC.1
MARQHCTYGLVTRYRVAARISTWAWYARANIGASTRCGALLSFARSQMAWPRGTMLWVGKRPVKPYIITRASPMHIA